MVAVSCYVPKNYKNSVCAHRVYLCGLYDADKETRCVSCVMHKLKLEV